MENAPKSDSEKPEFEEVTEELEKDSQRVEKRPLEEKGEEATPPCSAAEVEKGEEKDAKMAKVDGSSAIAPANPAPEQETVLTMDVDEDATNQSPGAGAGEKSVPETSEKVEKETTIKEEKPIPRRKLRETPSPEHNTEKPDAKTDSVSVVAENAASSVEPDNAAQETSKKESPCVKADADGAATPENSDVSTGNADASVVTESKESPKESKKIVAASEAKADATATATVDPNEGQGLGLDKKETSQPNTRDPNEETTEASPSPEPVAEDESDQISVDADEDLEIYDDNDTKMQTQLRHSFQHILEEEEPDMDKFIYQRKKTLQMAEACELELDDTTE